MKPSQLKLIQALSDLIIPLLGYFVWDWSLFFIVLFLLLDWVVFSVISFLKDRKVQTFKTNAYRFPIKQLNLTLGVFLITLAVVNRGFEWHSASFEIARETLDFICTKEFGIPQGILLLPLIALGSFMQFKTQFILTNAFKITPLASVWKLHHQTNIAVLIASILLATIVFFVRLPDYTYVFLIVVGSMTYRFMFRNTV